jgi:hypothetical protein
MEQKSRFFRFIENIVEAGYDNGCWHSLIFHTILLLIMAFMVELRPPPHKPIVLTITSLSTEDAFSTDAPEMVLSVNDSPTEDTDAANSAVLEAIADVNKTPETISDIEQPVIEQYTTAQTQDTISVKDLMEIVTDEAEPIPDDYSVGLQPIRPKTQPKPSAVAKPSRSLSKPSSSSSVNKPSNLLRELIADGSTIGEGIPKQVLSNGTGEDTGDIDGRLKMYGAKTGDIQISLIWNTIDDIDLHVNYSNNMHNETIFWRNRSGRSGGMLDIDMNGSGPQSNKPIENVFWPRNSAPQGQYTIGVHFFRSWSQNKVVPVIVRIQTLKGVTLHNATVRLGSPLTIVTTFSN